MADEAAPGGRPAGSRLIVALDTTDVSVATGWAGAVAPHAGMLKVGLEFFLANGAEGVRAVARAGRPLFLDLKLHDIPNTVAGGVRAVLSLRPAMLTVHAGGGGAMVEAARRASEGGEGTRPMLLAVTVLTSLDAAALYSVGVSGGVRQQVLRLARIAVEAGADGLVCSAHEAGALRDALGGGITLVVPGIRPKGSEAGDQARVVTPGEAVAAGADWIVVGRPITGAQDPGEAARGIAAEA